MNDPFDQRGLTPDMSLAEGWEIGPREAQRRLHEAPDTLLLDVRTVQERELACIAGSMHLPMEEIGRRLQHLREHEQRSIIVHCHHGVRSLQVTAFLREQGFEDVVSMAGGIDLWARSVDPGVGRY